MGMKDTTYLQHTSLIKFMAALGYGTVGIDCRKGFKGVYDKITISDPTYLSMQNAVALHNGNCFGTANRKMYVREVSISNLTKYLFAGRQRLVKTCYIQRKDYGFHLQKKQIQLTAKGREYVLDGKCGSNYQWLLGALKEEYSVQ